MTGIWRTRFKVQLLVIQAVSAATLTPSQFLTSPRTSSSPVLQTSFLNPLTASIYRPTRSTNDPISTPNESPNPPTHTRGRQLSPALLPAPRPAIPTSFDVPETVWDETVKIMFPNATTLQWYWPKNAPRSPEKLIADEAFDEVCLRVVHEVGLRLKLLTVLWAIPGGQVPEDAHEYSFRHREDRMGRYFVILASYSEEDNGRTFVAELVRLAVWFSRSRYLVFLDTYNVPEDRRCSDTIAGEVAAAIWRTSLTVVGVIMARCTWRIILYSPLQKDPYGGIVTIHQHNVSLLEDFIDGTNGMNFHDQSWSISIYPSAPTLTREVNPDGTVTYGGVDAWVMLAAAKHFKFTPEITFPKDKESRGYAQNGTGSGTLGHVMKEQTAISFNCRFIKDYNTKNISFTYPYVFDELCVMVPLADRIPNYITLFRCFSVDVWCALLGLYVTMTLTIRWLDRMHAPRRPRNFPRPDNNSVAFTAFNLLLAGATVTPHGRARENASMVLFGAALIFSVVFMGAFQGLLYKSLSSPQYYPDTETLEGVADLAIPITTRSESLADTFAFPTKMMRRLQSMFQVVPKNWTSNKPFSYLLRRNGAFLFEENKAMHLVEECPRKYMVAYITNRNFPYLPEISMFLIRCMDAGLMNRWLRLTYEAQPESRPDDDLVLSLNEVEGGFFILAIGVLASTLVFSAELLLHRVCRRWTPPAPTKGKRRPSRPSRRPARSWRHPPVLPPPRRPPQPLTPPPPYYYHDMLRMHGGERDGHEMRGPDRGPGYVSGYDPDDSLSLGVGLPWTDEEQEQMRRRIILAAQWRFHQTMRSLENV